MEDLARSLFFLSFCLSNKVLEQNNVKKRLKRDVCIKALIKPDTTQEEVKGR